jgi:thymidylate kinase
MNFLILLDGAKGAGKSSVCDLLQPKLPNTFFTGYKQKPKEEDDLVMMDVATRQLREHLNAGENVVIHNHLTEKRLQAFSQLGEECGAVVLKYHLTAPVEVLLRRLRQRDTSMGRETDEKRFHAVHRTQQAKDFSGFKSFDTTILSSEDIAESILQDLKELSLIV